MNLKQSLLRRGCLEERPSGSACASPCVGDHPRVSSGSKLNYHCCRVVRLHRLTCLPGTSVEAARTGLRSNPIPWRPCCLFKRQPMHLEPALGPSSRVCSVGARHLQVQMTRNLHHHPLLPLTQSSSSRPLMISPRWSSLLFATAGSSRHPSTQRMLKTSSLFSLPRAQRADYAQEPTLGRHPALLAPSVLCQSTG